MNSHDERFLRLMHIATDGPIDTPELRHARAMEQHYRKSLEVAESAVRYHERRAEKAEKRVKRLAVALLFVAAAVVVWLAVKP